MTSYTELKSLTKKELQAALEEARQSLLEKRVTIKTKHQKDTSLATKQKRYIARLMTALKQIELDEMIEAADKIDA